MKFDDQIGSRGIRHINIIAVPDMGVVEFKGESIAPVCRVLKTEFTKQGKWSHYTWHVTLHQGAIGAKFSQDWGTGNWFSTETWEDSCDLILSALHHPEGITRKMAELFIRATFPACASALDRAATEWSSNGDQFSDLLSAQQEHAAAAEKVQKVVASIEATEEAKRLRSQAASLRDLAAKGKGGSMSLADLKAALS